MSDTDFSAIGAASLGISAAALSAAQDAEARAIMASFNPATATLDDKRAYAAAVYYIHGSGEDMPRWQRFAIKAAIIWVLLCIPGAMLRSVIFTFEHFTYQYRFDTVWEKVWFSITHADLFLSALEGVLFGAFSLILVTALVLAFTFLFKR